MASLTAPPGLPAIPSAQVDATVERGAALWRELHGRPVLLTGGTGFFGRWLLEGLVRAGERLDLALDVTVLTRDPAAFRARAPHLADSRHVHLLAGDVRGLRATRTDFAHVIHAAAPTSRAMFEGEDPQARFETAFEGTRAVLEVAAASGARVLMVGSGSVYGGLSAAAGPVREDHPGAPSTLDAAAGLAHGKRAAEFLCACHTDRTGLPVVIARCFSFVGAFLPMGIHYAIGNFIRDALAGRAITVRGDGTPVRSYLFAGDLVVWLLTLLLHGRPRTAYNVGSEQAVALGDLARRVASVLAPGLPVHVLGQAVAGPHAFYVPDTARARGELGLAAWTPLDEAIRLTASAYRDAPWED